MCVCVGLTVFLRLPPCSNLSFHPVLDALLCLPSPLLPHVPPSPSRPSVLHSPRRTLKRAFPRLTCSSPLTSTPSHTPDGGRVTRAAVRRGAGPGSRSRSGFPRGSYSGLSRAQTPDRHTLIAVQIAGSSPGLDQNKGTRDCGGERKRGML